MTTDDRKRDLIEQAAKAIHTDYTTRYAEEPPVYHAGVGQPVWRHMARAAFAVFEQANAPSDDEREALAPDFIETLNEVWHHRLDVLGAAHRIADIVLRRTVQGEPTGETP